MALQSVQSALDYLRTRVQPVAEIETVAIDTAPGRVVSESICAMMCLPPADNSAMDGYAVRVSDLAQNPEQWFAVSQRVTAGSAPSPLEPGSVARIFTGGQLPQGADAIVIQEQVMADGDRVRFNAVPVVGDHVRRRGQDVSTGDELVAKGTAPGPAQIAQLAAAGIAELPVYRPLRVAIVSTGSELVEPGSKLGDGQIYNSNAYLLHSMLEKYGVQVTTQRTVRDNREETVLALGECAGNADLIISGGGVSVGEEDHVKPAVEKLGELDLWRLAIKPGKPMAFGYIGETPFFGLPGNPVSVFVTFAILVKPFIRAMQGMAWPDYVLRSIPAGFARKPNKSRQEYLRVRILEKPNGESELQLFASQDSSVTSSLTWANALAIVPIARAVSPGDRLMTISFEQIFS